MIALILVAEEPTKLFSGSIEFPCCLDYDLCMFYQGKKIACEDNKSSKYVQFSFLDSKDTHTIYFIITSQINCCTQHGNTVECLKICPGHQYICYKMHAKREIEKDDVHELLTWEIKEHTLDQGRIPTNSLIFLFNPNLIAGLKLQTWKPENLFRIIPTVMINPTATAQELKQAIIIARLAALDIDAFHTKTTTNLTPTSSTTAS